MNILQANKFFYARGGAETVLFETIDGLRARGHRVAEFAMQHPKNLPSNYSRYFASPVPELLGRQSLADQWRTFKRLFYSHEISHRLARLVEAERIEVAHFHNMYHHLSAASFTTMFELGIPLVLTLHDVFPLCPNHSLLRGETLDDAAYKGKTYNCIRYKCINNKLLPSIAGTLEAYFYKWKHIWDRITLFVCPSQFMADKMVEWGYPREKMRVVFNPFRAPDNVPDMPLGDNVLYLGRIHYEKGIKLLLGAAKELPNTKFMLVGTGPDEAWVDDFIQKNNLKNVERWGYVPHGSEKYFDAIRQAKVMVTPSLFYENCSMTILETLFYKRIPVAVNRGGSPEMVIEHKTGFLAQPEDANDLARAIAQAMATTSIEAERLTAAGRELALTAYSTKRYIDQLEIVYREAIEPKKN
jgi:glycosyltransferase involved in cell wall biosynthesis